VSIALDFLAQETQVSHAHAKRSSTRAVCETLYPLRENIAIWQRSTEKGYAEVFLEDSRPLLWRPSNAPDSVDSLCNIDELKSSFSFISKVTYSLIIAI